MPLLYRRMKKARREAEGKSWRIKKKTKTMFSEEGKKEKPGIELSSRKQSSRNKQIKF